MKIYTGRGDEGQTDLRNMDRVSKTNPRIESYGAVDEANALIGTIGSGYEDIDDSLREIQNHLHIIQADFADPAEESDAPRLSGSEITQLEEWIDAAEEELEPLRSFILPGGSDSGAKLHHARTVVRRAERRAVALADEQTVNEHAITYLNRLSDALFVFARLVNKRDDCKEIPPTY